MIQTGETLVAHDKTYVIVFLLHFSIDSINDSQVTRTLSHILIT